MVQPGKEQDFSPACLFYKKLSKIGQIVYNGQDDNEEEVRSIQEPGVSACFLHSPLYLGLQAVQPYTRNYTCYADTRDFGGNPPFTHSLNDLYFLLTIV